MKLRSAIFALLWLWAHPLAAAWPLPRVPPGFTIERVAAEPLVRYPMFACLDDRGRLCVAESSGLDLYAELAAQTRKCKVRRLEDRDGDGRYETSIVFADKLVYPMGLAWRDGRLYVADPPDLVALQDRDGDGQADQRTVILTGFGHLDNGSLHGLAFGPDGLLYMTMGSPDGYRLKAHDGREIIGQSGALIRCRPDGSRPEVLCRGFVNLVEIAFLPTGEIIGTDNWFQRPDGGLRDALVDLTEGALYPYLADQGSPQPLTGIAMPAAALYPALALSGIERVRSPAWPEDLRGSLFSAQFNARRVARHELVRSGSTFRVIDHEFLTSDDPDLHPADVLEDADGSLLVVDTGAWYVQHCPTGRIRSSPAPGGIYRVRRDGAPAVADPWGLEIDWERASAERLAGLLADPRPQVRDRARRTLAARGAAAIGPLAALLAGDADFTTKRPALWALAAIDDERARGAVRGALGSRNDELIVLAARAVGAGADRVAAPQLARLLARESAQVRRAAAEALARCGRREQVPALVEALGAPHDAHLEHALVHALYRLARAGDLEPLLAAPRPAVRRAALVLLDQPHDALSKPQALAALGDHDPGIRAAAVAVLRRHAEWSGDMGRVVRRLLADEAEAAGGDVAALELIAAFATDDDVAWAAADAIGDRLGPRSAAGRARLLEAAAGASGRDVPSAIRSAIVAALAGDDRVLLAAAIRAAGARPSAEFDVRLAAIAQDGAQEDALRLAALHAVAPRRPELVATSATLLEEWLSPSAAPALRLASAQVAACGTFDETALEALLARVQDDPLIAPDPLLPMLTRSTTGATAARVGDYLAAALQAGWRPAAPAASNDAHSAADGGRSTFERLLERLAGIDALAARRLADLAGQAPDAAARVEALRPLLSGGDPGRGRQVFLASRAACSTCHRIGGEGGAIGPDLTRIGLVRSGRDLLESIVVPSSTFAQGYETYLAVTADGQTFSGVLAAQDEQSLALCDAAGALRQFPRDALDELRRLPSSLMPEGLDRVLSPEELRDLLAFLASLR